MAPVRKHNFPSKLSAKRSRPVKDTMELLEEGLYKINISNAMDLDAPHITEDFMQIDLSSLFAALIAPGIPPPALLTRSTNSASLLPLNPHPLV